ncbi:GNAT family N-acetyltransferase [Floridanema aerugineum]|uniref:GNAT family N-acetyltransferase n=1 Tax=Floridaenema aerugineum BLCC-F46 TaxID=3153654 RepID=A0ABV4X3S9_9CYAN
MQINLIKPDETQINKIAEFLAMAFEDSSGLSQICKTKAKGKKVLTSLYLLFRATITMQVAAKQPILAVIKDSQVIAVAVFQEPENHLPIREQIRWLRQVIFGISPFVAWNILDNLRLLAPYHPQEPHYYLSLLGVHPLFQGKGYARPLLDTLHALSKTHSLSTGIYLETANPYNVTLYQHFGYYTTNKLNINGIDTFTMFRPNCSH